MCHPVLGGFENWRLTPSTNTRIKSCCMGDGKKFRLCRSEMAATVVKIFATDCDSRMVVAKKFATSMGVASTAAIPELSTCRKQERNAAS